MLRRGEDEDPFRRREYSDKLVVLPVVLPGVAIPARAHQVPGGGPCPPERPRTRRLGGPPWETD